MTEEQCPHLGQWAVSQPSVIFDPERRMPHSMHVARVCRMCGKIEFLSSAFKGHEGADDTGPIGGHMP